MAITPAEIAETRGMVAEQNLDIRTITMGISLMGCADENIERMATKVYDRVTTTAEHLVETAQNLEREYGIPIVNKRVSVTPGGANCRRLPRRGSDTACPCPRPRRRDAGH